MLFTTDVITDFVNSINLFLEGHHIWGGLMLFFIFLPALYQTFASHVLIDFMVMVRVRDRLWESIRKNLFNLLRYLPGALFFTILYILWVIYTGVWRVVQPQWEDKREILGIKLSPTFTAIMKSREVFLESAPQSCLGKCPLQHFNCVISGFYIPVVLGPSPTRFGKISQLLGLVASILSLVKGSATWHLFTHFNNRETIINNNQIDVSFWTLLKSLPFFLPHTLFRIVSFSLTAAFLGYYSLIPFFLLLVMVIISALCTAGAHWLMLWSVPLSVISPCVVNPSSSSGRSLLKLSLLAASAVLLPTLTIIRILPLLSTEASLCTPGLTHLRLSSPPPPCSPCYQQGTTTG